MTIAITNGIKVGVVSEYQPFYSRPDDYIFAFSYNIKIENTTNHTVKLLSRCWEILDLLGAKYEIKGEGVVGLTPTIEPGDFFEYTSGCGFSSHFGKMRGSYLMQMVRNGKEFEIDIPEFLLQVPWILN